MDPFARCDAACRCLFEGDDLSFDLFGREKIVGVEELNEVTTSDSEPGISRGRRAPLRLANNMNSWVRELGNRSRGVIGRPVVDDDDLEMRIRLRDYRADRLANPLRRIECGNDHRNELCLASHQYGRNAPMKSGAERPDRRIALSAAFRFGPFSTADRSRRENLCRMRSMAALRSTGLSGHSLDVSAFIATASPR